MTEKVYRRVSKASGGGGIDIEGELMPFGQESIQKDQQSLGGEGVGRELRLREN